jgi:hypothetical protein
MRAEAYAAAFMGRPTLGVDAPQSALDPSSQLGVRLPPASPDVYAKPMRGA